MYDTELNDHGHAVDGLGILAGLVSFQICASSFRSFPWQAVGSLLAM
jgi:hypothetical protein